MQLLSFSFDPLADVLERFHPKAEDADEIIEDDEDDWEPEIWEIP